MSKNALNIVFVTYDKLPDGNQEDQKLCMLLGDLGHRSRFYCWDDPSIDWNGFDAVILRSCWDYYFHYKKFLSWAEKVSQKSKLLNPYQIVLSNFEKSYLLELEKKNVPIVPSLILESFDEMSVDKFIEKNDSDFFVIKPSVSAWSYLTYKVKRQDVLKETHKWNSIFEHSRAVMQPYIESIQKEGEISLIYLNDKKQGFFSHAVHKKPSSTDFRVQEEFGGVTQKFVPDPKIIQSALQWVDLIYGDWLYARVDIVDFNKSPLVSEIEMIEPELYFRFHESSYDSFIQAMLCHLGVGVLI